VEAEDGRVGEGYASFGLHDERFQRGERGQHDRACRSDDCNEFTRRMEAHFSRARFEGLSRGRMGS
jgi:hypothetical protein